MIKKFLLIIFCLFLQNTVFAENFYIENYDVNLKVNKDKSVNVQENILVNFHTPSHGIYRTIPFKNGSISNVSVDKSYSSSYSQSLLNIKIGDPDVYVNGRQRYKINYTYTIKDTNNEFYYNIIGTEWTVPIRKANFSVTMPQEFDFDKTGLSIGRSGTKGFDGTAKFKKDGLTINGYTTQTLSPNEGITIRIAVPERYFTNGENIKKVKVYVSLIILISTLISVLVWFIYGKDEHVTPVVTFYPPKDINCIDAELIYNEKVTEKGLVALLTELAGKGYIKIDYLSANDDFSFEKISKYNGSNPIEKEFIKAIFFGRDSFTTMKTLQKSSLFYQHCQKLVAMCNKNNYAIFEDSSLSFRNKSILMLCIITIILTILYTLFGFNFSSLLTPTTIYPLLAFIILLTCRKTPFLFIWALGFGGIPMSIIISENGFDTAQLPIIYSGLIGLIISSICYKNLVKKSKLGQKIMAELLGLKKFIEVAEKHRLESLVEENPNYFYDILPYAYILGVSEKWINKLEQIIPVSSEWYRGNRFRKFSNNMHSAAIPTTSNGGIRSSSGGGGGHSGGGHGGGGGGSW